MTSTTLDLQRSTTLASPATLPFHPIRPPYPFYIWSRASNTFCSVCIEKSCSSCSTQHCTKTNIPIKIKLRRKSAADVVFVPITCTTLDHALPIELIKQLGQSTTSDHYIYFKTDSNPAQKTDSKPAQWEVGINLNLFVLNCDVLGINI